MKKIIFFTAIIFTSLLSKGQKSEAPLKTEPKTIHKLGVHAGTTSGLGISYKALFNNKTMIQLVTIPVASKNYKYINSGISLKLKFKDLQEWDFYSYGALNHIYNYSETYFDNFFYDEIGALNVQDYNYTLISKFNSSIGISAEYGDGEFIKWNMQLGYGIYNLGTENWRTLLSIGTTIDFSLNSK